MKPIKKLQKPEPTLDDQLEAHRSKIIELGQELDLLSSDLERRIRGRIEQGSVEAHDFVIKVAREHFNTREETIVRRLYDFLNINIFWEHAYAYGSSISTKQVEEFSKQGFTFAHTVYNPSEKDVTRRHGVVYRRPKVPDTFEKFKALYDKFVLETAEAKKKQKEEAKRKALAAAVVDEDVAGVVLKKTKLAPKKAVAQAVD